MAVTASVARFLSSLPVESRNEDAQLWIGELALHISKVMGAPVPAAFANSPRPASADTEASLAALDDGDCTPDLLGLAWEQLLASADRRAQGAHFTPRPVADRVTALALEELDSIGGEFTTAWDPTAGGGAFLLAAARAIERRTRRDRAGIVGSMFATDIDATALRVCDAALELWSRGTARPTTCLGNSLLDLPADWPNDFSLVVGNPPFLGQLTSDTARSRSEQRELKDRFGALAAGYVDHSSLFVEVGIRHLGPNSVLALVLPQSFLGAESSTGVREAVSRAGSLRALWIDDAKSFAASVEVIAVLAASPGPQSAADAPESTRVVVGSGDPHTFPTPSPKSWAPLLARSQGVPMVSVRSSANRLADIATITAGFRQHFYGIGPAVREAQGELDASAVPAALLMTSGSIDPFAPQWGHREIKFAGNHWKKPWLYFDLIEDAEVRAWFEARLVPKVLVASQTPVIEAIVDVEGTMVPSVPVITIEPKDPRMLFHVAAVVSAPTTCAALVEEAAGTGLSAKAIRVKAKSLGEIRLPPDGDDWDRGAASGARAQAAWLSSDLAGHQDALFSLGEAMTAAYGGATDVTVWWKSRVVGRR